eukprot:CAMPEP_0197823442 /NCGR_PEP_ID=MMETSP1437-20131217/774_1 /TAXON_ID=49252 ORGANISM="Eucampia antarctica, Strain CCMP1452" /NCGR_SAMPLE_ID=MMETSP1437 /ASSEMBLY_ACC=CAM_ASM_001096 /LENGTH=173 /DNA_ID=CAMNT_0043422607 /DNA_START=103 /DNA_END=624 /DNA_ORIENTATION=+
MKLVFILSIGLASIAVEGFVYPRPVQFANTISTSSSSSSSSRLKDAAFEEGKSGIQNISLDTLSSDHESEGSIMAISIAGWLDQEWLPQQVHKDMAESAKQSYIKARKGGETDIMSVMFEVGHDLELNWKKYDDDAFVNAWDVGNYVSDYLNERAGNESCECASQIFVPEDGE